jgi:hypothetical protein
VAGIDLTGRTAVLNCGSSGIELAGAQDHAASGANVEHGVAVANIASTSWPSVGSKIRGYAAAKAALNRMTRRLAIELGPRINNPAAASV